MGDEFRVKDMVILSKGTIICVVNVAVALALSVNLLYIGYCDCIGSGVKIPDWLWYMSWILPVAAVGLTPWTIIRRDSSLGRPLSIALVILLAAVAVYSFFVARSLI